MTEIRLSSEAGQAFLTDIPRLFEMDVDVPPTLAARLSVEIGSGQFDKLAGRILMAARGDLDLDQDVINDIVSSVDRGLLSGDGADADRRKALRRSKLMGRNLTPEIHAILIEPLAVTSKWAPSSIASVSPSVLVTRIPAGSRRLQILSGTLATT